MCFSIKKKERVSYFMSHDIDNDVSCLPLHIVLFSQKKKKKLHIINWTKFSYKISCSLRLQTYLISFYWI